MNKPPIIEAVDSVESLLQAYSGITESCRDRGALDADVHASMLKSSEKAIIDLRQALEPVVPPEVSRLIASLDEFLEWRGFEHPYEWARAFYKYTDCGPWAAFFVQTEPERVRHSVFAAVFGADGRLSHCVRGRIKGELADPEDVRKFLFDPTTMKARTGFGDLGRRKESYLAALQAFCDKTEATAPADDKLRWSFDVRERCVLIRTQKKVPPVIVDVYYEDIGKPGKPEITNENCVGVRFGSIVEGSEATAGPYDHMFPFLAEEFDSDVKSMEDETSFYWERDNSTWYQVSTPTREYIVRNTWGDIVWEGYKPGRKLRDKVEALLADPPEDMPKMPGSYRPPQPDWKPMSIPGTRSTIHEFTNDSDY